MDVTEIGAFAGTGILGAGGVWGWLKLSFKQKEDIRVLNVELSHIKSELDKTVAEFEKLESKVDNNKDTILDKLAEMQKDLGAFKSDIMKAILEKK